MNKEIVSEILINLHIDLPAALHGHIGVNELFIRPPESLLTQRIIHCRTELKGLWLRKLLRQY